MLSRKSFLTAALTIVSLLLILLVIGRVTARPSWQQKVDEWVLETGAAGEELEFIVVLEEQADLESAAALDGKLAKGSAVYQELTEVASRTQGPVIAALKAAGANYRPYWISNMIWARGDAALVESLARRADVARVYANPWTQLDLIAASTRLERQSAVYEAIEPNIEHIGAPNVWAEGVTGQGAVIGGQDTGYDWTHPALKGQYRGWDGSSASHDYNWHDAIHEDNGNTGSGNSCSYDSPEPCDDGDHGTHTMGTMVGAEGSENRVGVAPGAKWIACRNMEQGWGTPATYAECYEWFVAPYPQGTDPFSDGDPAKAPHVINNSWSCPVVEGCTDPDVLRDVVENVRAAGIVTVHSAANDGSVCGSVREPAAIYDASFTVGATDNNDQIAGFSSRGPALQDGGFLRKPDISAPGVNIRSTLPGERYGWKQGTSMAAPHVAGVIALLISAQPDLAGDVDRLEEIVEQTAVPRYSGENCGGDQPDTRPNNTYGWGRIDAWLAYKTAVGYLELDTYFPIWFGPQ